MTVPANGSVQVKATLSLNEEGKQYMEENFSNGNYLEGYVYLNAETDAEAKLGVSQSIPFLAFWGNWTDSSMFDTSVYAEDLFNEMPHKYLNIARENYYNVKKAGSGNTFNLGVNLYANDDAFLADRTAVRAGDTLMTINYNLIRNAQDVSYVIRNAETGEVYFSKDYGKQSGAFYYTNGGYWSNTVTTKGISWRFTDNEGNALPNNTKLELVLTAVPEYYTADENGNYTGLGKVQRGRRSLPSITRHRLSPRCSSPAILRAASSSTSRRRITSTSLPSSSSRRTASYRNALSEPADGKRGTEPFGQRCFHEAGQGRCCGRGLCGQRKSL